MISEEEYKAAVRDLEDAQRTISSFQKQQTQDFKLCWEKFEHCEQPFTDDELVYAASARCEKCNAGLAYPKQCGGDHQWTCSNVLKCIGRDKNHTALSFIMYEVKSENQPSAMGRTTRPKKEDSQKNGQEEVCQNQPPSTPG